MSNGLPMNLKMDDLGAVPALSPETIRKAQLNAADMLGPECGDILDMLGIKKRVTS